MGRRQFVALMTFGLIALTPGDLVTEQLTLTTYYPSPYGVYEELRSTKNAYFAYSAANSGRWRMSLGTNSPPLMNYQGGPELNSQALYVSGSQKLTSHIAIGGDSTVSGTTIAQGVLRVTGAIQRSDGAAIRAANGGHVYTYGATGWRNWTYGGGWYMADSTWIRTFGNKNIYHNTGIMRTDGELQVGSSGSRFRVRTNGRVGVGTTNPQYKLDVSGDMRVTGVIQQACRWVSYSIGSQRFCSSKWSAMSAADSGGIIRGGVPTSGWMFCCKLRQY